MVTGINFLVAEWFEAKKKLDYYKEEEINLRKTIFGRYFSEPKEGTNKVPLNDGSGAFLIGKYVINRQVDPGSLQALYALERADETVVLLPLDRLIKSKPELVVSEYRSLNANQRDFFDRCLIIKPGIPQLEIVVSKKKKQFEEV
jgi:hypothetical protein